MNVRDDFPIFKQKIHGKELIYLDSAATAHKPKVMIDAISNFYTSQYGTVHRAIYNLSASATRLYSEARQKVQRFINASKEEEIIFTKGTTEGINLVSKIFITPGDVVIVPEIEHHSNIVPWQLAKAKLKTIKTNDSGEIDLDHLESLLKEGAKLLSLAHISNTIGVVHPIKKIIDLAHSYNVKVLIDAAQSASHKKIDVQALDADFLVFSGHKLYGPTGIGVLYGKLEIIKDLPPYQGGGDMIFVVNFDETKYNEPPLRFEAGTPPIAEVIGLAASIDYIEALGLENIEKAEHKLLERLLKDLTLIDHVNILGRPKERGSLVSFTVEGVHSLDVGTMLDLQGVAVRTGHLCSQPTMQKFNTSSVIRASFAIYNTEREIDLFVDKLKKIVEKLRS
jgi:cysteine desulfurase/selenocysteine lyase